MPKNLSPEELKDLERWLLDYNIVINGRTRRDFSDVVPVAQFMKHFNTRLINMYNYPARNSVALKYENWDTFNRKVLAKLGIAQSTTTLQNLAQGLPGAIEAFLFEFMLLQRLKDPLPIGRPNSGQKIRRHSARSSTETSSLNTKTLGVPTHNNDPSNNNIEKDIFTIDMEQVIHGRLVKVAQKVVDFNVYENVARESREKDNYINSIIQKSLYLESIIKVKDERINELVEQLSKLSVSILSKMRHLDSCSDEAGSSEHSAITTKATTMTTTTSPTPTPSNTTMSITSTPIITSTVITNVDVENNNNGNNN